MFQHHVLMAIRNLKKHRGYFVINLVGLSTGMACALMIWLWVRDEQHFDKFHKNDAQLFQVMEKSTENGAIIIKEATQGPLAAAMEKDLPEIEMAVPVFSLQKENIFLQLKNGTKAVKESGIFAGTKFFNAFSFPLLKGNAKNVLASKHAIVISEGLAKALFGSPDEAMGKTIDWEVMNLKNSVTVTGVFAPLPDNNSLQFDLVMTYDLLLTDVAPNFQHWWNEGMATYLVLKKGQDVEKFNAKITGFIKNYFEKTQFSLFIRPYSSAYLYGK
jgi:putative ABC transport system permease protein